LLLFLGLERCDAPRDRLQDRARVLVEDVVVVLHKWNGSVDGPRGESLPNQLLLEAVEGSKGGEDVEAVPAQRSRLLERMQPGVEPRGPCEVRSEARIEARELLGGQILVLVPPGLLTAARHVQHVHEHVRRPQHTRERLEHRRFPARYPCFDPRHAGLHSPKEVSRKDVLDLVPTDETRQLVRSVQAVLLVHRAQPALPACGPTSYGVRFTTSSRFSTR
jgi:hypothetical protein